MTYQESRMRCVWLLVILMHKLDIKPLSVNQAWQGRRFKTKKYDKYISDVLMMLPKANIPDGRLELHLKFGFSNKGSDFDNPIKCFVDCLQKKYGFNDNRIKRCVIDVDHVKKGEEFIEFEIKEDDSTHRSRPTRREPYHSPRSWPVRTTTARR